MQECAELLEIGIYATFEVEEETLVSDLLSDLNLEGKFFGILVDGKKAEPNQVIHPKQSIVILPHIKGG